MDARWRNLLLIVAVIIVAIAAYLFLPFVFPPAPIAIPLSFKGGLAELDSIWAAEGASFFMPDSELEQLPKQKILSLQSKTSGFRERVSAQPASDESPALLALSNVYLARLDVFLALKELDEAQAVYTFTGNESDQEVCAKVSVLDGVQSSLESLQQKLVALDSEIGSFELAHPAQFEKTGLVLSTAKAVEVGETIQSNALLIAEIKGACA